MERSEIFSMDHFDHCQQVSFSEISPEWINARKRMPWFKSINIHDGPESISYALDILIQKRCGSFFHKAANLVLILIELDNDPEDLIEIDFAKLRFVFGDKRPFILEIRSYGFSVPIVYYKDSGSLAFYKFDVKAETDNIYNMMSVLQQMHQGSIGAYKKDGSDKIFRSQLNQTRINLLTAHAAKNALTTRFILLFEGTNFNFWPAILSALKSKKLENFLAIMELPIDGDVSDKAWDKAKNVFTTMKNSDKNQNLLELAIDANNSDVVKYLADWEFDLNSAANHAWEIRHLKCFVHLVKAEAQLPESFDVKSLSCEFKRKLERILRARGQTLFPFKSCRNLVCKIVCKKSCFENLGRDSSTKSPVRNNERHCTKSNNTERSGREENFKRFFPFREPNKCRLVSKSFFSTDFPKLLKQRRSFVKKIFKKLGKISQIVPILKIASKTTSLRIVFDFDSDTIKNMVPWCGSDSAVGGCESEYDAIYIAAKKPEAEVLGILTHELAHHAMYTVYNNDSLPYPPDNDLKRLVYRSVFEKTKCESFHQSDEVTDHLRMGFNDYTESDQLKELIVRVAEVFALFHGNPEVIKNAKALHPLIFEHFEKMTLPDIEEKLKLM